MKIFDLDQKVLDNKILIIEDLEINLSKYSKNYNIILILDTSKNRNFYKKFRLEYKIHNLFFIQFDDLKLKIDFEHRSIKQSEKFFYFLLKNNYIDLEILSQLYFNKNIENSIKKHLTNYCFAFEKISFVYNKLDQNNTVKVKISSASLFLNNYFKVIDFNNIIKPNFLKYILIHRLYNLLKIYYLFFRLLFNLQFRDKKKPKQLNFINLYNSGFRIKNNKLDIVADWISMDKNKNEFLFITEDNLDFDFLSQIKEKKLEFYSMYNFKNAKIYFSLNTLIQIFKKFYKFHKSFFKNNIFFSNYITRSFIYLIKWETLLYKYNPKIYFSYQNNNEYTYLRNVILRHLKCKTIFYEHTSNNPSYYVNNTIDYPKSLNHIYNNNEIILVWNKQNVINYKKNKSEANFFLETGPIWTNFFLKKKLLENFSNIYNLDSKYKYISFFPTSLSVNSFNKEIAHFQFFQLIIDFIDDKKFNNYRILFKTKVDIDSYINEMGNECKKLFSFLQSNDRFYQIRNNISSIYMCRFSDLVINMPFSSTFHEGLAISKRALFYDSNESFKVSHYNKFKNIVYSNSAALIEASIKLLDMNENELNTYYSQFTNSDYYSDPLKLDYIKDKIF